MPATLRPFDYQKTFLHQHIDHQRHRTDDVLALEHILKRIANAWADYQVRNSGAPSVDGQEMADFQTRVVKKFNLLDEYFYGRYPDRQTYFPVKVKERDIRHAEDRKSLSGLLNELHGRKAKKGVLLSTRSGAGKTVAALRAFFDTLRDDRELVDTLPADRELVGFLPIWLRFSEAVPGAGDFEQLVWNSARPDRPLRSSGAPEIKRLQQWIRYSPPMLLFVDLNAAPDHLRSNLAKSLTHFQAQHFERGHRVIVAYRSSAANDPVFTDLGQTLFEPYDLLPIDATTAIKYVTHIREFESWLILEMQRSTQPLAPNMDQEADLPYEFSSQLSASPANTKEDIAKLKLFITRYVDGGNESIVSTPLLMHLCSIIPHDRLASINSLSDLYHHVVEEQISTDRTFQNHGNLVPELNGIDMARPRILGVLGRVAVKMLAETPTGTSTRLSAVEFQRTLEPRRSSRCWRGSADDLRVKVPNLPLDFGDADNLYAWAAPLLDPPKGKESSRTDPTIYQRQLTELVPVRREGDFYAFLHDSFTYYFAARLLREWAGPTTRTKFTDGCPWYRLTAKMMAADPLRWLRVSEFLAEQMSDDELKHLFAELFVEGSVNE